MPFDQGQRAFADRAEADHHDRAGDPQRERFRLQPSLSPGRALVRPSVKIPALKTTIARGNQDLPTARAPEHFAVKCSKFDTLREFLSQKWSPLLRNVRESVPSSPCHTRWSGASAQPYMHVRFELSRGRCGKVSSVRLRARSGRRRRGARQGITRCAVSAVSVVEIGQMCRSCIAATPSPLARKRRTAAGSIAAGTAAIDIAVLSSSTRCPRR